ncbi:MAG: hypothetical protein HYY93_13275 [Planctomycetes bacterium]|nr:hypothetical protein [Planctomycetota bacterium]
MRSTVRRLAVSLLVPFALAGCHSWRRSAARDFQASFPQPREAAQEAIEISQATEGYGEDRIRALLGDDVRIVVHVEVDLSAREVYASGVDPSRVVEVRESHSEEAAREGAPRGCEEPEEGGEGEEGGEEDEEGDEGEGEGCGSACGSGSCSEEQSAEREVERETGEMRVHSVERPYRVTRRTATLLVPGSWLRSDDAVDRYRMIVATAIGADPGEVTVAPIPGTEGEMERGEEDD